MSFHDVHDMGGLPCFAIFLDEIRDTPMEQAIPLAWRGVVGGGGRRRKMGMERCCRLQTVVGFGERCRGLSLRKEAQRHDMFRFVRKNLQMGAPQTQAPAAAPQRGTQAAIAIGLRRDENSWSQSAKYLSIGG